MPHFDAKNSPTAWFAVLERARLTGDELLEARARRRLADLGVVVRFDDPATQPRRVMSEVVRDDK